MVWQVALAVQVASGLGSASASRKAGKAALREARAQAGEVRLQKQDIALLATQQHEQASEAFAEQVAYNTAAMAAGGRTGRSAAALRKREERLYGRDVDRIRLQEAREKAAAEKEAQAIESRGVQARKAYRAKARGTLLDTAIKSFDLVDTSGFGKTKAKTTKGNTTKLTTNRTGKNTSGNNIVYQDKAWLRLNAHEQDKV